MRFRTSLSFAAIALAFLAASAQPAPQSATKHAQKSAPSHESQVTVAQTPPMGWNSWNFFAGKVTDQDIRDAADELVSSGMKDAGYVYINIDDTWEGERDASGVLHTNSKFPDMKALADYVHSKGLKLGIYSSPGPLDLWRLRRLATTTSSRMPDSMPRGASITSSTICAASGPLWKRRRPTIRPRRCG